MTDSYEEISEAQIINFVRNRPPENLDGIWHPSTQRIAERLGAKTFDINKWWCLTAETWLCPGCGRGKPDIARINRHGELMCHLVEHHDHMDKFLEGRLGERISQIEDFRATDDSERFVKRLATAVSAFDEIIICEDCNNVDVKAKKLVGADPLFSFTASDIKKFILASPNQPHEIDRKFLAEVWSFRREQLQKRIALADQIVDLAANNLQWYERADPTHHAKYVVLAAKREVAISFPRHWGVTIEKFEYLSAPKPSRPENLTGWRRNKKLKATTAPNQREIDWVKVTYASFWKAVHEDWACPWCQRDKLSIMRPSKQAKWSFNVKDIWLLDKDTRQRSKVIVCQDCSDVRIHISREAGVEAYYVDGSHISSIILPQPHCQHHLRPDAFVDQLIEILAARLS